MVPDDPAAASETPERGRAPPTRALLHLLALALCLFGAMLIVLPALAYNVGDACPTANEVLGQTASGAELICDAGTNTLKVIRSVATNPVREGIGTASPAATLHVNGEAIVGKTSLACAASTKGALRYDSSADAWTYCNGSTWVPFESAAGCSGSCTDASPAAFAFTDQPSVAASTLITSDIAQLTGFDCTVTTSISGNGSPAYRICADSGCSTVVQDWTSGTNSATSGQYVQVRLTSSATDNQTYTATLTAGETSSTPWSVRTLISNCGPPSPVGTVCPDGTVYAGLSPDGNVPMYTTRCDLGQTWNGSSCTGTRTINITWNNGSTTTVSTGYTDANTGRANTAGLAALNDAESPHYAAQTCSNLTQDLYSDWYLPARNELGVLYSNRAAIGGFYTSGSSSYNYHSSTETASNREHRRSFVDGSSPIGYKNNTVFIYMRCVRRN